MPHVFHTIARAAGAAFLVLAAGQASAHIGYGSGAPLSSTSRDLGNLVAGTTAAVTARTVTSNFGWADASDAALVFDSSFATTRAATTDEAGWALGGFTTGVDNLYFGDSHKGTAFRLHLDSTLSVTVSLQGVSGLAAATGGALTPGFSVYKGLAALAPLPTSQTALPSSADYDFSAAARAQRSSWAQAALGAGYSHLATQGNWNALGDWSTAGDGDLPGDAAQRTLFSYVGSATSTAAGGTAMTTLTLDAGDYTVFVGGNDLATKTLAGSAQRYGFQMSVSAVSAVPEPHTALLLLLGAPLLARRLRRAA